MPLFTFTYIREKMTYQLLQCSVPAESSLVPEFVAQGRYPSNEDELNQVTGDGKYPI